MKKILSLLLVTALTVTLAACGGDSSDTGTKKSSGGGAKDDKTISVCLASEPDTIDPALNSAVDGASLCIHLFSGLAKWNEKNEIVPDAAEELVEGVENEDGTVTYTYTLRDGLTWSDGEPVTAKDFEFAWKRAASPDLAADYGYMFEVVDGYTEVWEQNDNEEFLNPDAELNVKAIDDKTLEVTTDSYISYWNELLAFPTYFPVREDVVSNESWATDPSTYISNGLYKLTAWEHNSVITLEKNENHPDTDTVKMDAIKFYLSDDENNMLSNFQNGTWQLIDTVPNNEIAALKENEPDQFFVEGQLGTYYACWNVNENILPKGSTLKGEEAEKAKAEIRQAVSLLLDRNYIVEDIAQAGQVPASSFVAMGLTDADGNQFYESAGNNSKYNGYYDVSEAAVESNYEAAIEILKKYYTYDEEKAVFTDMPSSLTYLYNTDEGHKAIGEYIQSAMGTVGMDVQLENQEWATFLNTRKAGDYSIARNGWLADYNDPICFLDMWVTNSGNNDIQFGRGEHEKLKLYDLDLTDLGYDINVKGGTWAETYDVLVSTIKSCADAKTRTVLLHRAEDLLMSTGCVMPIYYYTDIYMLDSTVQGFYTNPLGYKYFMYCEYK